MHLGFWAFGAESGGAVSENQGQAGEESGRLYFIIKMKMHKEKNEYTWTSLWTVIKRDSTVYLHAISAYKYPVMAVCCLIYLVLCIFSLTTLFTMACLAFSLWGMAKPWVLEVQKNGVAAYLPESAKNALLNRSLLDILCDLWFIPTLSLYLKTILAPMLSSKNRSPAEAVKYLDELDPDHRKVFITKGLAFLCPKKIKKILLPKDYCEFPMIANKSIKKEHFLEESDNDSTAQEQVLSPQRALLAIDPAPKSEPENKEELIRIRSTDISEEPVIPRQTSGLRSQPKEPILVSRTSNDQQPSNESIRKKSKVLMSSSILRNIQQMPGRLDARWDNMQEYEKRKKLGAIKKSDSTDKLSILKLVMDLKSLHFMKKIDSGAVTKVGIGAGALLLIKFMLFKRVRAWSKNLLILLLYLGGVSVVLGAAGLFLLMRLRKPEERPTDLKEDNEEKSNDVRFKEDCRDNGSGEESSEKIQPFNSKRL